MHCYHLAAEARTPSFSNIRGTTYMYIHMYTSTTRTCTYTCTKNYVYMYMYVCIRVHDHCGFISRLNLFSDVTIRKTFFPGTYIHEQIPKKYKKIAILLTHVYTCTCTYIYRYMYMYMYMHVHVYMYVYMYMCTVYNYTCAL